MNIKEQMTARRPVAILINGYGDRLLTLPAMRALADVYDGRLGIVCCPGDADALYGALPVSFIHEATIYSTQHERRLGVERLQPVLKGCDFIISFNPRYALNIDALIGMCPGVPTLGIGPHFSRSIEDDRTVHWSDIAFKLPQEICPGMRIEHFAQPPSFPKVAHDHAEQIRRAIDPSMRVLAVQTQTQSPKEWPQNKWFECLDIFLDSHEDFVVLILDLDYSDKVDRMKHADRMLVVPPILTLQLALTGSADVFVGIDSCKLHAADLFGTPCVALFGSASSPIRFGVRFTQLRRVVCTDGPIAQISVGTVLGAIDEVVRMTRSPGFHCRPRTPAPALDSVKESGSEC